MDESDPDIDLPNIVHAFQAAERAREEFPDDDWLHFTALIHDLGKVMAFYGEPQWAVVGDTFPVGCLWSDNIVYRDTSFIGNVDGDNPAYKLVVTESIHFERFVTMFYRFSTKYGMYEPNCGITNLRMSWGHDEYMYHVLKHNKSTLPDKALHIIVSQCSSTTDCIGVAVKCMF